MAKLFEVFGYPTADRSPEAEDCRRDARCPFMDRDCDGGGNRYLSRLDLRTRPELKTYFRGRDHVHAGVCSIQPTSDARPWIVCPRRLLVLAKGDSGTRRHQETAESVVLRHAHFPQGSRIGVWSEIKLKHNQVVAGNQKSFDYTFDYVLMSLGRVSQTEIVTLLGGTWAKWQSIIETAGYTLSKDKSEIFVEDFPHGPPVLIEIMTSSTSGGNKTKRSTIPAAFEDVILGNLHLGPGINYRQVWARMVSQLIVKSEVGLAWGGQTLWILQDTLVDYISKSTALNMEHFLASTTSEVNIVSLSYGETYKTGKGVIDLQDSKLFAGLISPPGSESQASFQDMIRVPVLPPISKLFSVLAHRAAGNVLSVQ